ncbi:hypothetical protein GYA28_02550 [Candidatus Roizmanbacteria bacterium]|jgi:hypothetical protein|nr:hypothetical protein [Candidatus Roizmanbacteria bacterium]
MWSLFSVYLGKDREAGIIGFIAEENFFLIIEDGNNEFSKEKNRDILSQIREGVKALKISSLAQFEEFVNDIIKKYNLPASISLASGYLSDRLFYLKTVGHGRIFLKRSGQFKRIIEGDTSASGYIEEEDYFIFANSRFVDIFGREQDLHKIFDHRRPNEVIDFLTPQLKSKEDEGAIALFVQFGIKESSLGDSKQDIFIKPSFFEGVKPLLTKIKNKLGFKQQENSPKRTLTLFAIVVILIILLWSVGLGYRRRQESLISQKIKASRELIVQKLSQAEEVAFLNLPRAQIFISEAKIELNRLKSDLKDDKNKEWLQISALIEEKENKIVKKEERPSSEFFDLAVDSKEAKGEKMYLDGDNLSILDGSGGAIYLLSLEKKSLEKKAFKEIKRSELISFYGEEYFFGSTDTGIYKIGKENKSKKVIEKDKDWGKLIDMAVYNGNIYLIDREKDQIYKYLVTENGYSAKNNYFKSGQDISLRQANSLAIDSSLYIGLDESVVKYTAGERDGFKTDYPEENVVVKKVVTNKDLDKVYVWDKNKGVYILDKNGSYERQIRSSSLAKATDIVVYQNNIYALLGSKIFKISAD